MHSWELSRLTFHLFSDSIGQHQLADACSVLYSDDPVMVKLCMKYLFVTEDLSRTITEQSVCILNLKTVMTKTQRTKDSKKQKP